MIIRDIPYDNKGSLTKRAGILIREEIKKRSLEQRECKKRRKEKMPVEQRRVIDAKCALQKFNLRILHMAYMKINRTPIQKAMPNHWQTSHEKVLVDQCIKKYSSEPEVKNSPVIFWNKELLEQYLNEGLSDKITFKEELTHLGIQVTLLFRDRNLLRIHKGLNGLSSDMDGTLTLIYHELATILFRSAAAKIIETEASISAFKPDTVIYLKES